MWKKIKMKMNKIILLLIGTLSLLLTACSPTKLNYQIDPDFSKLAPLIKGNEIIFVSVSDNRIASNTSIQNSLIKADIPDKDALRTKLTQYLKDNQHKIINRVLLADLGLEIKIQSLELLLESGTFKGKLSAKSTLEIIIHKKSNQWSKVYKASRVQEVATPVNNLDTTGVINQMLTKQFESIFTDAELSNFISN